MTTHSLVPLRTDWRYDAYLVVGAVDERRGLRTQRSQRFGDLRHGHIGVKSESSQRLSDPSSRLARLLFKTEDQLEDRVGWKSSAATCKRPPKPKKPKGPKSRSKTLAPGAALCSE
jgi:hypothetical protein